MNIYLEFDTKAEAIQYRAEHGTGGWIFVRASDGKSVIFPWRMTPREVITHRLASGNGEMIGTS